MLFLPLRQGLQQRILSAVYTYLVPWTARRPNQSTLKEIKPEYSLEGQTLKLKLQYFGHLMPRANSLEKILMLEKCEGKRRKKGDTEDKMVGWLRI